METIDYTKMIRKIGKQEALLATGIALLIDTLILVIGFGKQYDSESFYDPKLWATAVFAFALLIVGQLFGQTCAKFISKHSRAWWLGGIICAFATLFVSAAICGLYFLLATGEIIKGNVSVWENIVSAVFALPAVFVVYSSPVLVAHGLWFGYRISNKIKKLAAEL
ncbi:hypothetical protein [Flavobacterium sp.]|uniref:hypothetical protein n=1 Tax=Flavobacterium sp. TaxID=239 RepID=UPI00120D2A8B|nr:hypothetical protein [Flavobacterium sp.]RZJ70057.1 MAG: hypothetical protein EOO49_15505 [Flavobacterium sp.]